MRISDWSSDVCSSDLWTATRLTLDAMGGAAAICDVNGCLVCANQAWAEKAGGYRAPAELAGTDAEAVDAVARAQQQAWQQGSATVVFAPAEGDRKSVGSGKRVADCVGLGGRRIIKKKKQEKEKKDDASKITETA